MSENRDGEPCTERDGSEGVVGERKERSDDRKDRQDQVAERHEPQECDFERPAPAGRDLRLLRAHGERHPHHELQDDQCQDRSLRKPGTHDRQLNTTAAATRPVLSRSLLRRPIAFIVLIGANMPSILAEISFVSNPEDARRLQPSERRQQIAESLYRGVARYVNGLSRVKVASRISRTSPTEPTANRNLDWAGLGPRQI